MTAELYRCADACILPGFDGSTAPDWLLRRAAEGLGGDVELTRRVAAVIGTRSFGSDPAKVADHSTA